MCRHVGFRRMKLPARFSFVQNMSSWTITSYILYIFKSIHTILAIYRILLYQLVPNFVKNPSYQLAEPQRSAGGRAPKLNDSSTNHTGLRPIPCPYVATTCSPGEPFLKS